MQRSTRTRVQRAAARLGVLVALAGAGLATAGAASAADLIVLAPDKATISGPVAFTHVYVGDGATLDIAGDTLINAADVYVAGGARIVTCFTPPAAEGTCAGGRNLAIVSSGQITIGTNIDLEGGAVTPRPAGALALTGTSVSISGGINTSGAAGGTSGSVSITSSGPVSISSPYYAASILAPGAPVSIHAASISLSGDVNTAGSDANIPNAGSVDLEASGGPLSVFGNILAAGRDGSGGSAAPVLLRGTDIRAGAIDTSAGSSGVSSPGNPAAIDVGGTTSATISGATDARGASGGAGFGASPGANVRITSGGPVVTGAVTSQGADANSAPPGPAGSITISGAGVATGALYAFGGNRSTTAGPGGTGSNITVISSGAISIGDAEAFGGNSAGDGIAGATGGSISVTGLGVITSELRTTPGSSAGNSPGGAAGSVAVNGTSFVSVLGGVYATGGSSSGGASWFGGSGGAVQLHAAAGPLALSAPIRSGGGNGGNAAAGVKAGPGGAGGPIDLVGTPIDPIAGISSEGGDGGFSNANDLRGNGGNGGVLHAWSETNLYAGLRSVSTAGGSGAPPGVDGAQLLDSAPTGLTVDANGLVSFTSHSPYADGFNIYAAVGTAAPALVLTTRSMSHVALPPVAVCTSVSYSVNAFRTAVRWTSPVTPAVAFTRQPSATQKCTDPPGLSHGSKPVLLKAAGLKKHKGTFSFLVTSNGIGAITATATTKGQKKPIATATATATKAGSVKVTLKLNPKLKLQYKTVKKRQVARITVKLAAAAPTGAAKSTITVAVEVRT